MSDSTAGRRAMRLRLRVAKSTIRAALPIPEQIHEILYQRAAKWALEGNERQANPEIGLQSLSR
jgi:hypothetical protein